MIGEPGRLVWWPELGCGYYPVEPGPKVYDQAYFDKYVAYAATDLGRALTSARVDLVRRFLPAGTVIDIGIGCGDFIVARNRLAPTFGYDVNPAALAWLGALFRDPLAVAADGFTWWDTLEHVPDPIPWIERVDWHFVAMPIFTGPEHLLRSKHFRRDENCHYFTRDGLIDWFGNLGFNCLEHSTVESLLGREDIHSFVFRRQR